MRNRKLPSWLPLALTAALALAIVVIIYFTVPAPLSSAETLQVVSLIVLVGVTLWYAFSTHSINVATAEQVAAIREQAVTSRRALRVALDAEQNAVIPIVKITLRALRDVHGGEGLIVIRCANIGRGPALNLRGWPKLKPFTSDEWQETTDKKTRDVLGIGEESEFVWRFLLDSKIESLAKVDARIVTEYSDIYGRKFSSTLNFSHHSDGEFTFERPCQD